MCDTCSDFLRLLFSHGVHSDMEEIDLRSFSKTDIDVILRYTQSWSSRQCMCCYRVQKHIELFSNITQSVIYVAVRRLKELSNNNKSNKKSKRETPRKEKNKKQTEEDDDDEEDEEEDDRDGNIRRLKQQEPSTSSSVTSLPTCEAMNNNNNNNNNVSNNNNNNSTPRTKNVVNANVQELDKILVLVSQIFLLNFPLYVAFKRTNHQTKLDDVTQQEMQTLNLFCDLHDPEIPIYLLRNVSLFCKLGGLHAITACFTRLSPEELPVSTAHATISVVCNLKLWMNFKSMVSLLVPLRSCVLRYMCKLYDQDLRTPTIKSMADFMWNTIKDPLDTPMAFDLDGLDLAFKYFTSSTLTMRLAGIAQINSQIGVLAELCVGGEALPEAETAPNLMANWLIDNNIVSHIFGPNLHVEVIKQSHIVLNFLAMEGRVSCENIDTIWSAAQMKHCAKPIHDLLPGLVKHLSSAPALHLYNLLVKMEPKDHTEQTLFLASALIKFIWTRGGANANANVTEATSTSLINLAASAAGITLPKCVTSSEISGETSGQSESHKSDTDPDIDGVEIDGVEIDGVEMHGVDIDGVDIHGVEIDDAHETVNVDNTSSEGPTPCKMPRKVDRVETPNELRTNSKLLAKKRRNAMNYSRSYDEKKKHHIASGGATTSVNVRKKMNDMPDGVETIGSSTSQEEGDNESPPVKFRKKRKIQPKTRVADPTRMALSKRMTCINLASLDTLSDSEGNSDPEHNELVNESPPLLVSDHIDNIIVTVKNNYLEESSSSSELGKETSSSMDRHAMDDTYAMHNIHHQSGHILELLSGEEAEGEADADGSYSSRMSTKSDKNMADFDGEDSVCEEELAQLAETAQMNLHSFASQSSPEKSPVRLDPCLSATFKVENICQPGNTLLWDLLQDNKICQLGSVLALECEKTLCNLLCYNTDRSIRMRFIEGCLNNLANNTCVIVSLRLLPKLLTSFEQFRGDELYDVTNWAEKQHHMMEHFFNNLKVYANDRTRSLPLYTHQMQVQVRLHFLSAVFSILISPIEFRLSIEQMDVLWACLAHDRDCSDELFSWLLSQAKSTELHGFGIDVLKRLYLVHLPSLPPEKFSMTCLNLFQELCTLARVNSKKNDVRDSSIARMDHLWKIALRANNTDVSMASIQYLNNYYMGHNLQYEEQFVAQCMQHLAEAAENLKSINGGCNEEGPLLCIQRALLLLKTHIETFRKRYAYHLRRWSLEGNGVTSHGASLEDRSCQPIRFVVQPGSMSKKCTLDLLNTDYVADLRAEIVKWWEDLCKEKKTKNVAKNSMVLQEGPIRIIALGQELMTDTDEKTLGEMGFKDNQAVFISVGVSRNVKKRYSVDSSPSLQPAPPRESIPALLLLQPHNFEQLFCLMHTLSAMTASVKGGRSIPHTKAQVLSRRIWDILSLLPTSPTLLRGFQQLDTPMTELLNPASPQKLMYSLYIVETLSVNNIANAVSSTNNSNNKNKNCKKKCKESWSRVFIENGGLSHLFDIFMSGVLQRSDGDGSEWHQDCLASLLKLLCQLGLDHLPEDTKPSRTERILIPCLNEAMLSMLDVDTSMNKLATILDEASLPRDPNHYKTGFWGRAQVIHYAMALLVSWLHCSEEARQKLFEMDNFSVWLQRLLLDDPEPAVRREICSALYRLCLGATPQNDGTEVNLVAPMLAQLLTYLEKAQSMRPQKIESIQAPEDGKEPYGPVCRDYFWLVSRLVDSLPDDLVKESLAEPQNCCIDINGLTVRVAQSLLAREYFETRHNTIDDEVLIALLNLSTNLIKHRPPFQSSKAGQDLLCEVFDFLFALPNPKLRQVPKCKSMRSRTAAFDLLAELVKGSPDNYDILHGMLLRQHQPGPNSPYPWDYWPHEDGRSECGYVGLTNLGATCYMASCMQHLYMMPQARASILAANTEHSKHESTLKELQRMFAYLLESERKAYNPRSFCKVYTMDHQPLNTAEQKDMAEFFIDLVSKLEEMTPHLKNVVKNLFCGVLSNNVVSLDCNHVSRTLEEFYTVRCQVADMRNLYESLDEVTVKDTLEGDNMYTCSQCGKKVRAEKRACFKKLPHILCFNTMRYTFNMLTMLKEKVNTHFSFPLRLNMAGYMDKQLMPQHYQEERVNNTNDAVNTNNADDKEQQQQLEEQYEYDLIGVTVHTGTADGGHYYSFIKDRTSNTKDKWFLFNDAEVKPFDPNQIAAECFGGEMTSKTYDSVTDKFMDFSFEKTNSAYMLFYERCPLNSTSSTDGTSATEPFNLQQENQQQQQQQQQPQSQQLQVVLLQQPQQLPTTTFELSKELADWIWEDNMHFIQAKNIFEHTYFNFMWQICGYIPQTILPIQPDVTQKAAQLATSFFIETFIHAKEKPTMVQWVELVTKQFNACQEACIWFLEHMSNDTWWPVQILLKCPNQMVRQMFQRLCIHVIQRLRQSHASLYLLNDDGDEETNDLGELFTLDSSPIGNLSCVTKFVKTLMSLMEHGAKAHLKHLTEYFGFLYEFTRMGEEECKFMLRMGAIHMMVDFYLGHKVQEFFDVSEEEEEEEIVSLATDKYKPASLDKMITLIATLVEKSRGPNMMLKLGIKDHQALIGGKGFPFLYQQIKDNINLHQTRNLVHSLCRANEKLAPLIIEMISQSISRNSDSSQTFFKLLTLLTESGNQGGNTVAGPSGLPCFTELVLQKVWDAAECCPHLALDWLALQVTRNRLVHQWVMSSMNHWLQHFLIANQNQRVRNAAGYLLVSLVPSTQFHQGYRASHRLLRETQLPADAQAVLHKIYAALLRSLSSCKQYTDIRVHGTMKLTTYFALLLYCCVSKKEKLMFGPHILELWYLFHPKLSEPSIPAHHNKQALLAFWNHVCTDCPENVKIMLENGHITKNIAFNYILADHDDQEIVLYNRAMLPAYYGLLRMMCQQSRAFTLHLAQHQNLQWAFKNITPYPPQYPAAVEELFKLMELMVMKYPDMSENEHREIINFRRATISTYLQSLDGRTSWTTLITAYKLLVDDYNDKFYVVYNGGLQIVFESFQNLHVMLHEATACHVTGELIDILSIMLDLIRCIREYRDQKEAKDIIMANKDWLEVIRKLATLLNTYNPPEMRMYCIEILKELLLTIPNESLQILIPLLSHCHSAFQDTQDAVPLGPYFPRKGHQIPPITNYKGMVRPIRPMVQMTVPQNQLECTRGIDPDYDDALDKFYRPYHVFIDALCKLAVSRDTLCDSMVTLSAMIGFEAVPLHSTLFPNFWLEMLHNPDRKYVTMLTSCNYFVDYIDTVLLDERTALNIDVIYEFLTTFFPKVSSHVLSSQTLMEINNRVVALTEQVDTIDILKTGNKLLGDLRALVIIYSSPDVLPPTILRGALERLQVKLKKLQEEVKKLQDENTSKDDQNTSMMMDDKKEDVNVQNVIDVDDDAVDEDDKDDYCDSFNLLDCDNKPSTSKHLLPINNDIKCDTNNKKDIANEQEQQQQTNVKHLQKQQNRKKHQQHKQKSHHHHHHQQQQQESDSDSQYTSCSSDDSVLTNDDENNKNNKTATLLDNLIKLETTVNELIALIERKA